MASMVRSPGWAAVLKRILIPEMQHATQRALTASAVERETDYYRGMIGTVRQLCEQVYACAGTPSPFYTVYAHPASAQAHPVPPTDAPLSSPQETPRRDDGPRRTAYPVV